MLKIIVLDENGYLLKENQNFNVRKK